MVDVGTLRKLDIFEGLSDAGLEAVSEHAGTEEYPAGFVIFREGEEAGKLYVLLEGRVAVQFDVARHQEAVVHTPKPGMAFGWSALVQPCLYTSTARCMQDSKVITIDREGLRDLLEQDCHTGFIIMEKLAQLISARLRDTRIQLISMIHG